MSDVERGIANYEVLSLFLFGNNSAVRYSTFKKCHFTLLSITFLYYTPCSMALITLLSVKISLT